MNKNITLIIPTCGKGNIKECLESINKYTVLDNINIIVSANGCSNDYCFLQKKTMMLQHMDEFCQLYCSY